MKVEILSQLQNIGTNVTNVHQANSNESYNAILRWCRDVVEEMQQVLNQNDSKATLNLMQSIKPKEFAPEQDKIKIEIIGDYYWKYVNYGVDGVDLKRGYPYSFRYIRPSANHIKAIKKWITDKPVTIDDFDDTDAEQSKTNAAYAIATGTKKRGITARPFVEPVLTPAKIKELVNEIALATNKEIKLRFFGAMTNVSITKK